jgi:hypothetical protein
MEWRIGRDTAGVHAQMGCGNYARWGRGNIAVLTKEYRRDASINKKEKKNAGPHGWLACQEKLLSGLLQYRY